MSTLVEGESAQPCCYRRHVISSLDFARALDGDALVSKFAMLWPTHSGRMLQLRLLIHAAGGVSDFCSLTQKRLSPVQNVCQGQAINTGSVSHSFFQCCLVKKIHDVGQAGAFCTACRRAKSNRPQISVFRLRNTLRTCLSKPTGVDCNAPPFP